MAGEKLWKTKPLASWQKAKEFRKDAYANIGTAHEKGEFLFLGASIGGQGWGKTHTMDGEAYRASIANMGLSG